MAFPADPLDLTVQLYYDDAWQNITGDVLARDLVRITRGRGGEGAAATPTSMALSLRNDGTYSPRNPSSALYGKIGRNTPVRAYVGTAHLGAGGGSETASTSHVAPSVTATGAGLLITGWLAGTLGNYSSVGGGTASAELDGSFSTMIAARHVIASSGATGTKTATFSTSQVHASASAMIHGSSISVAETLTGVSTTCDDITLTTGSGTAAGDWLVLVQGWTRGVDTDMPSSPAGDDGGWILLADSPVIGESGLLPSYQHVRIWARRVNTAGAQAVIAGGVPEADTLSADNHSVLYRLTGVTDWDIRATCEIPAWPVRSSDVSGADTYSAVAAAGILRRLGQGSSPLRSALRRALTGQAVTEQAGASLLPVAYWPLEDTGDATQAASGLSGGAPMVASGGAIEWASVSSPGSAPLPDMRQSVGVLTGPVTGVTSGSDWSLGWLVQYTGTTSWSPVQVYISGGPYVRLVANVGSSVTVTAYTDSGSSTLLTEAVDISDGLPHYLEIWAAANGLNVDYKLHIDGSQVDAVTVAGGVGTPTQVRVQPRSSDNSAAVGHVGVWQTPVSGTWVYLVGPAYTGHAGEVAGRRMERLCRQEGIALHVVGDLDSTVRMGPQGTESLLDLLRACEAADGGILYEPREALGLAYRTRTARYNQSVTLGLDYSLHELTAVPEPQDDDRYVANDVTASRDGGSSARYEVTSGPLSTLDPPDGIGRYDDSVTLGVELDSQLPDQASWRAHLGTVDEARYPTVQLNLAELYSVGKSSLARAARAVDAGDRLTVANAPSWLPVGGIDQQVEGYTETLGGNVWAVDYVCTPASAWTVATYGGSRYGTSGSELAADLDAGTDTSMSVAVTSGPLWTTAAGDMPLTIRCGGAVLTVTAISGASSPQTFTVSTTVVNGVARTIPAGSSVELATPAIYAL